MAENCIFCKLASRQIPVHPLYEDAEFLAFHDLNPQAPVHVLVIPKAHFATLMDVDGYGTGWAARSTRSKRRRRRWVWRQRASASSSIRAKTEGRPWRICTFICSAGASCSGRPADRAPAAK